MTTPRLGLDQMSIDERSGYVTYNEVLRQLQAQMNVVVENVVLATPPVDPEEGKIWYVATAATGAWVGQDKDFAQWYNGHWYFTTPVPGTRFYISAVSSRAYIDASGDVVALENPIREYQDLVLTDSPFAYWPLNELTGSVVTDVAGSSDGGIINTISQGANALVQEGTSYDFTSTGRISVAPAVSGDTWSFECWFEPDALTGYQTLVYQLSPGVAVYLVEDKLSLYFTSDHLNDTALIVGQIYHVVLSVDAGSGTWYLNGTADGTIIGVPQFIPVSIGASIANDTYFDGRLDQVAFYQSALTAPQVLAHYNQGIGA